MVNTGSISRATSAKPAAVSQVERVLSNTASPPNVSISHRRSSPQTPIVDDFNSNRRNVVVEDVIDDDDANADANQLSDESARIADAVGTNRAADNVRVAAANRKSSPNARKHSNTTPARRTQSADAVSKKQKVPSRAQSGISLSEGARRKIPFNTATLSPAAKFALVRRMRSPAPSTIASRAAHTLKRRNRTASPAARKRVHVEDGHLVVTDDDDGDENVTPTRRSPTARIPIQTSVRTNPGGGATINIANTPQSLNTRNTSITVDSNFIHVDVGADQSAHTETNNISSEHIADDIDEQHALVEQRPFMEVIMAEAKKKRTQHMTDEFCNHLKNYIRDPSYINSPNVSDAMRRKIIRHCRYHRYSFMVRDKIDENGVKRPVSVLVEHPTTKLQRKRNTYTTSEPLEVVPLSEIEMALRYVHVVLCHHAGQDATWRAVTSLLCRIPRDWCREYCARCRVCAIRARKVHKTPLNPIITKHILYRIVIDTIDLSHCAVNGFRYIFYAVDHFSKFHWALVTQTKEAVHAVRLFQIIFSSFGPSKFVQCDNGREFRNRILQAYLASWNCKLIFSRVRHPQTNGAIERANGHLKVQIHKWREEHAGQDNDWPSAVYQLVHAINCTRHTTTKYIPYEIIYNRRSLFYSLGLSALTTDTSQNPIIDDDDEISETDNDDRDNSQQNHQTNDIMNDDDQNINLDDEFADMEDDFVRDAIGLDDTTNNNHNNTNNTNHDNNTNNNNHHTTNRVIINDGSDSYIFHNDDDEHKYTTNRDDQMPPADNVGNGQENTEAVRSDEHLGDLNINHFGPLGQRCHALLNVNSICFVRWGCFGRGLCSTSALYTAYNNRAVTPIQARALRAQMLADITSLGARWYDECCPVGSLPYQAFIDDLNAHGESMGMEFFYVASRLLGVNIYVVHVMIETDYEFVSDRQASPSEKESVSVVVELANKDSQLVHDETIAIYHRHRTTITRLPPPSQPTQVEGGHYEALVQAPIQSRSPWPTNHPATVQLEAARRNTAAYANTVYAAAKMKALYDRNRRVKIFKVGDVVVVAVPAKLRKKSNAALNFPAIIVDVQPVANGRDQRYRVMTTKGVVTNTMSAEDLVQRRAHSYPELTSMNIDDWQLEPTISMQQAYADANTLTNISNDGARSIPTSNIQHTTTTTTNDTSEPSSSSSSSDNEVSETSDSDDDDDNDDIDMLTPDTRNKIPATQTTPSTGTSALSSSSAASIIRPLYIVKANKPTSKQRKYQVAWGTVAVPSSQPDIVLSKTWESADWFSRFTDRLSLLNAFTESEELP